MHRCLYGLSSDEVFHAYPYNKWENRQFRDLPLADEHKSIRGRMNVDGMEKKWIKVNKWLVKHKEIFKTFNKLNDIHV